MIGRRIIRYHGRITRRSFLAKDMDNPGTKSAVVSSAVDCSFANIVALRHSLKLRHVDRPIWRVADVKPSQGV